MPELTETLFAASRARWRAWLGRNHLNRTEIWLLLNKKHVDGPCVSYEAAVEEALCFGWIDGVVKRIDDRQYAIRFSPRKRRSVWAESNKRRVARMISQGKMTEAGLAMVEEAKQSGEWYRQREATDSPPADLRRALARNRRARDHFRAMAPSHRRIYIAWINDAKKDETRERRIREVVRRSAANRKPGA